MSKRIVDQHGKPFKPSISDEILKHVHDEIKYALLKASKPSAFAEQQRLEELRRSCGVEPVAKTITFRRSLPYGFKPE